MISSIGIFSVLGEMLDYAALNRAFAAAAHYAPPQIIESNLLVFEQAWSSIE
jgi:hypothetical protein